MSDTPLTKAQEYLLVHGPNFAIVPECLSNGEYITTIEQACQKLSQREMDELRVEVKNTLKKAHLPDAM